MKSASYSARLPFFPTQLILLILALTVVGVTTGCGSGGSSPSGPRLSGNTSVTVLLSSTANDQLSQFDLELQTITLTSQSGKTVNLLSAPMASEFIHLNGRIEPLTTVTVPQDIYTAATATIGGADFTCVTIVPPGYDAAGALDTSTYAYGYTPNSNVTVTLPAPITVTGDSMGLSLDLLVSQSATYASCYPSGAYSITPTFNLTPAMLSAQPTNPGNGKVTELEGEVTALGATAGSFTLSLSNFGGTAKTISVTSDSGTECEGIGNSSALQVGTFVDMDGAVQPDGSLLATRIAVYDPATLNVMIGPLVNLYTAGSDFYSYGLEQQGQDYSVQGSTLGVYSFADSTSFQISGQLSNVGTLPFAASFSGSNMVPGQNVAVFSKQLTAFYGGQTTLATTMTLMPQTIDGTVEASSTSGSFTVYTVLLAGYDLFPDLAVQQGQTNLLSNPNEVEVYVDGNTQMLNTQSLAAGSTLRFYGLVFNDNGALRMDCAQVNDGMAFSPQSNASNQLQTGEVRTVRREGPGGLPQTTTVVTRSH